MVKKIFLAVSIGASSLSAHAQCNINATVCLSGVTSQSFSFVPKGTNPNTCLEWLPASNVAYISLSVSTTGPLNLLISGNASSGYLDVALFNIPAGEDPCTAILDTLNQIACNYASDFSGCNQFGTAFPCTSSVPAPIVNAGQRIMIVVENWSNASSSFTLTLGTSPAAQAGIPSSTIPPISPTCSTNVPFQLKAVDMGGTWSGVGVSPTGMFDPSIAGSGLHTVTYSIGPTGCNSTSTNTVNVDPLPIAGTASTPTLEYCGEPIIPLKLTGSLGSINWQYAESATGPWTTMVGATNAEESIMDVYADIWFRAEVSQCGITVYSNVLSVKVTPAATAFANIDQEVCGTGTVNLAGMFSGSATSATWSAPSGTFSSTTSMSSTYTPSITSGSVILTLTTNDPTGLCPAVSDQMTITIYTPATVNAVNSAATCEGSAVNLTASIGGSATSAIWSSPSGFFTPNNTLATSYLPTTVLGSEKIYLTTNDPVGPCPAAMDSLSITVNAVPVANAGVDKTICIGNQVTLIGQGGLTSTWNHGVVNAIPFTPLVTKTYTLTVTNAANCSDTDAILVTVSPLPAINGGADISVCIGDSVTLTASGEGVFDWNHSVSDGVPFVPSETTVYTLTGTVSSNCVSTDQVTVTVHPLPTVYAGKDLIICEGETVTLIGEGANTYTWTNNVLDGIPFTPPVGSQVYTVKGTSVHGCSDSDQITVKVNSTPTISVQQDKTWGCSPVTVNFVCNIVHSATCTWQFSNGETYSNCGSFSKTFIDAGCIGATLNTVSTEGCSASKSFPTIVCVDSLPTAKFESNEVLLRDEKSVVELKNLSSGATSFVWNFGDGNFSNSFNATHDYWGNNYGNYTVSLVAISATGCKDTSNKIIQYAEPLLYYVPNSFTPDDNSLNQTFKPIFTLGYDPYDYTLSVFNRWGELIFETNDTRYGWDGTYGETSAKKAETGIYGWRIEFQRKNSDERNTITGYVNVMR